MKLRGLSLSIRAASRFASALTGKLQAQHIVHDPPHYRGATRGNGSPFALGRLRAARGRCPSIQKCSALEPPEHLGTANIQPFRRFPPRLPLSSLPLGFLRRCALFATLAMLMRGLLSQAATSRLAGETALRSTGEDLHAAACGIDMCDGDGAGRVRAHMKDRLSWTPA